MQYKIQGDSFPVVTLQLHKEESVVCQKGAMVWMSPNMEMQTQTGGLGKIFAKAFTGESIFTNVYTAKGGEGEITFGTNAPGRILDIQITPSSTLVAQKSAFLASEASVNMDVFFQKNLGAGFFGGEGFIMQKFSGSGMVFLEMAGSIVEYDLAAGQSILIDTGYLAAMDSTCSVAIEKVKGFVNVVAGGEGFFNTKVTGPGHVW
jgi:uncharacterized protein (TIGR00266 family)